ncbi:MAG: lycopene cyclase domain-containing protein [Crocinitomicaceae bacterium]|jgi:lycopene cyclase domain-containing protein
MSLYGWVMIFTIIGPFALSFDKKVHFYTYFNPLFKSIVPISTLFIFWDILFTKKSIWGFTADYISTIKIVNLPLEEVLFFILVPFACLFIYEVVRYYFPNLNVSKFIKPFNYGFIGLGLLLITNGIGNWYTCSAVTTGIILVLIFGIILKKSWYGWFVVSFLVALIPFLIVNGILTGATTPKPIVWYSENHIVGWRIITIPVEDIFYNLSLLLPITAIFEFVKKK